MCYSPQLTRAEALENWVLRLCGYGNTRALGQFLLRYAQPWSPSPLPSAVPPGPPRTCYGSSQQYLLDSGRDDLTYVEGIACPAALSAPLPLLHGWLVGPQGQVIDRVWRCPEDCAYLGVAFRTEYVLDQVLRTKCWGSLLDCPSDGWALLSRRAAMGEVLSCTHITGETDDQAAAA